MSSGRSYSLRNGSLRMPYTTQACTCDAKFTNLGGFGELGSHPLGGWMGASLALPHGQQGRPWHPTSSALAHCRVVLWWKHTLSPSPR